MGRASPLEVDWQISRVKKKDVAADRNSIHTISFDICGFYFVIPVFVAVESVGGLGRTDGRIGREILLLWNAEELKTEDRHWFHNIL